MDSRETSFFRHKGVIMVMDRQMKVTYLYHSGFTVELQETVLIFDYYMGDIPVWDKDKTVYVFASHKHKDHFNLKIFDLYGQYKKVHFFLGSDIKLSEKYLDRNHVRPEVREHITNVRKNSSLTCDQIKIETLRSTDAGVAFLVRAEGCDFYHAGDLNWWHWEGESEVFNQKMGADYRKEIDRIAGRHFDVAFVPLDSRQEEAYRLGMDYFLEKVKADHVFPMHMWDTYDWAGRYLRESNASQKSNLIAVSRPGEEFVLWNI